MNADDRESAIEAILADTKTAMTGLPALHEMCGRAIACGRRQIQVPGTVIE
jgi:hypothetical protein